MAQAYLPNTMPLQPLKADTSALLKQSLEEIIQKNPQQDKYEADALLGIAGGPTGLAYFFLRMSQAHPDLQIQGHDCIYWAQKYIAGDRGALEIQDKNCGFVCEKLAYEAVKASITKDEKDVAAFLSNIPRIIAKTPEGGEDPFPSEMLYGRAAVLYLLRLIRKSVPDSADSVNEVISRICQKILDTRDNDKGEWLWNGKRYYGAPHGDIGIITQIVLSEPSLALKLKDRLERLLDLQNESGNWSDTDEVREDSDRRVQFCHGAPGFIFSLQSLRPYYPELHERFDNAIEKGREVTWARGILVKEPSLCHGLFGNGLSFPKGEKRDHFLSLATPDSLENVRKEHPDSFTGGSYGMSSSPLFSYLPSAAWTWTVFNEEKPTIMLFNDI